ncbi:Imm26 family immunity protein [Mesorhizobium sp. SB112]|uniref:Imm26 family immunity protein n=1 Tax=Mesorhizobium sp. SB112 TaxID=3151853 RepID=UPI003266EE2E
MSSVSFEQTDERSEEVKKVRKAEGDIFKVPLDETYHTYAVSLLHPLFGFFDARTSKEIEPEEIEKSAIIFSVWVMDYAAKDGLWTKIGRTENFLDYKRDHRVFKQDVLSGRITSYCDRDGSEFPIDYETACNMEAAAVWDPHHVEERLRDHFAGKSNRWVESLRPRQGNS